MGDRGDQHERCRCRRMSARGDHHRPPAAALERRDRREPAEPGRGDERGDPGEHRGQPQIGDVRLGAIADADTGEQPDRSRDRWDLDDRAGGDAFDYPPSRQANANSL